MFIAPNAAITTTDDNPFLLEPRPFHESVLSTLSR